MNKDERIEDLENALKEVMKWIDNWGPNFIYDDEWPETKEKIDNILKEKEK